MERPCATDVSSANHQVHTHTQEMESSSAADVSSSTMALVTAIFGNVIDILESKVAATILESHDHTASGDSHVESTQLQSRSRAISVTVPHDQENNNAVGVRVNVQLCHCNANPEANQSDHNDSDNHASMIRILIADAELILLFTENSTISPAGRRPAHDVLVMSVDNVAVAQGLLNADAREYARAPISPSQHCDVGPLGARSVYLHSHDDSAPHSSSCSARLCTAGMAKDVANYILKAQRLLVNPLIHDTQNLPAPAAETPEAYPNYAASAGTSVLNADAPEYLHPALITHETEYFHHGASSRTSVLNADAPEFYPAASARASVLNADAPEFFPSTYNAVYNDNNMETLQAANTQPMTTLMIKNIPNCLRKNDLRDLLDDYCVNNDRLDAAYDFLYLVMDSGRGLNKGYGFVNFTTSNAAEDFATKFHNNYNWKTNFAIKTRKVCQIANGHIQGLHDLKINFQDFRKRSAYTDFLPSVFHPPCNGKNLDEVDEQYL